MGFFDLGLITALLVCAAGLLWRLLKWRGQWSVQIYAKPWISSHTPPRQSTFWTILADIVLLRRTGRNSLFRWAAHMFIFYGFIGLLIFHALEEYVSRPLFSGYESTLDPWQHLRNILGFVVLLGLAMSVWRRLVYKKLRALTRFQDWGIIFIVGAIVLSGFFLEATKIISPSAFNRMTDEYFVGEEDELLALKAYWKVENGAFFPQVTTSGDMIEQGRRISEDSCGSCHSPTSSAFVSRPMANLMLPLAGGLERIKAADGFWYIHVLLCFMGLALLPFGKFVHPLSTPANLAIRNGRLDGQGPKDQASVSRGLGLDACTRCGECSLHCSVAPSYSALGNDAILPSEKLRYLRRMMEGDRLSVTEMARFAEGSRICTECLRCTAICPSGINLQDLWLQAKELSAAQALDPNAQIRTQSAADWAERLDRPGDHYYSTSFADRAESYWACVQCTTCTSVCPVVAVSEDPTRDLDLAPQQIMNLLRMGLKEQTLGARMVWSCTTCYKCQEHCPQNIPVADVLYELRNMAAKRLRDDKKDTGAK